MAFLSQMRSDGVPVPGVFASQYRRLSTAPTWPHRQLLIQLPALGRYRAQYSEPFG
jgi:hypothetical protein